MVRFLKDRKISAVYLLAAAVVGCSSPATPAVPATAAESTSTVLPAVAEPFPARAYTQGERIIIERGTDRWDFLAGVNLGVTVPGRYPGELAIDAETYRRWFPMMTGLGVRVVRIYTIQRPHFYEELRNYNLAHPDDPLFLIQGVWIDEERLLETGDLYDDQLLEDFSNELSSAAAAVAGTATLPERPGRASGMFTADVSPWLVGWILGIELDPMSIADSDATNRSHPVHSGTFFSAVPEATPTESWFAARLDYLAAELTSRGLAMPLAFTNWPTTDPLDHPHEPLAKEDLVGIDANHIRPQSAWSGGYFASYHAYPYYPDFQRFDPGLGPDPYAGYLARLQEHHSGLPVLIAEFGVPGGLGLAHHGPLGRDQGAHSEQRQMVINAEMMDVIRSEGLAGGLLFEWADEWFKRTWNTIDYEQPATRRALWQNVFNNESHFGLLAIEPGSEPQITLDGTLDDWQRTEAELIFSGQGTLRQVWAVHDAAYLYFALRLAPEPGTDDIKVGFDTVDGESVGLPGTDGFMPEADYAWTLRGDSSARALVRSSNDVFAARHGGYFEPAKSATRGEEAGWHQLRLLTSYPLLVPSTSEEVPAESFAVGELVYGSNDPSSVQFDSRAVWYRTADVVEIRVPYAAIGISDPSSRQALQVGADGLLATVPFESVGVGVAVGGEVLSTAGYGWEPWNRVDWHERLKKGVDLIPFAIDE